MRGKRRRPKGGKRGKARQQTIHAVMRAEERYGLIGAQEIIPDLVWKIQHNEAQFEERQSHRVSIWNVEYAEVRYRVVYDRHRGTIASFLPPTEEE